MSDFELCNTLHVSLVRSTWISCIKVKCIYHSFRGRAGQLTSRLRSHLSSRIGCRSRRSTNPVGMPWGSCKATQRYSTGTVYDAVYKLLQVSPSLVRSLALSESRVSLVEHAVDGDLTAKTSESYQEDWQSARLEGGLALMILLVSFILACGTRVSA